MDEKELEKRFGRMLDALKSENEALKEKCTEQKARLTFLEDRNKSLSEDIIELKFRLQVVGKIVN